MDRIFYNGVIKTVDDAQPLVSAVCVQGGIIMRTGSDEEMLKYKTENTELIDLQGKFMLPGFIDSHMHMILTHYQNMLPDLGGCKTKKEVLDLLRAEADRHRAEGRADEWINAVNFNQDYWSDDKNIPTRLELDEAAGDVPCRILRCCGHTASHNTKALEIMNVMKEKPGETTLNMKFLADGTPQGQLFEGDAELAAQFVEVPSVEEYVEWIKEETANCAKLGLVGIHSDDFNMVAPGRDMDNVMAAYKVAGESGVMKCKVYEQCRVEEADILKEFVKKYPRGTQFGTRFVTSAIKEMGDGSLGAHSAVLRGSYANDPEAKGVKVHEDDEMFELFRIAHEAGYPVVVHCIGDGAVEQVLNGIEYAQNRHPMPDIRHGIVHCQIMGTDQLYRMQRNNVLAYVQPVFCRADAGIVDDCVGPELAKQSYNWRLFEDLGIHQSGGSDCPVEPCDPIPNIYYAVTRDNSKGGSWYPENAVTIEEAIRMFTIEGAYAGYAESTRGSITPGKYADFVVLSQDLTKIDPKDILNTKVLMTVLEGETVYEA
ncbi:MAG: amidohydrolase [Clostridia bacterium]|nr:amidohydrolase [Clostridia bacterium]